MKNIGCVYYFVIFEMFDKLFILSKIDTFICVLISGKFASRTSKNIDNELKNAKQLCNYNSEYTSDKLNEHCSELIIRLKNENK